MQNFKTTGLFKILSYGNFVTTFACLILATNYNSPRTVSVKVLTLPVAAKSTLHATKHFSLIACNKGWQKVHVLLEVTTQHDCLEERFCFTSTWFLYRLFIASKLMSSQSTVISVAYLHMVALWTLLQILDQFCW